MTLKTNLFLGWFIGTTIFTCFTMGKYFAEQYFDGSQTPWVISSLVALIINWWGCGIIQHFTSISEQKSNTDHPDELKPQP
ncbi:hypothetical protein CHU32_22455 [Superficieibacter electus]|uniref:Uncharacterized protein n=1 Tax=Superficieibacter electus TaxID=2022662 RepID=A0A2P5GJL5_9ENTR|nr:MULTISPECIES: hypothetical protein [Enterobacteriaceae]POP41526.1 hypothetical protein CHU33_22920 [Superficieibacter electus]POP43967.1 hypothetical protein CHU32_22455 [Superficieibacter electus]